MITTDRKLESLLDLCETLSYNQKIVYSDEGNLFCRHMVKSSDQKATEKPYGLWYSFGKTWTGFLMDCDWGRKRLDQITHVYELEIDYDKVLRISTEKEFEEFEKKYARKKLDIINWPKVAADYLGIEIRFMRSKVMHSPWYYGWDVSSGCLWDKDSVKKVTLLKAWEPLWKEKTPE